MSGYLRCAIGLSLVLFSAWAHPTIHDTIFCRAGWRASILLISLVLIFTNEYCKSRNIPLQSITQYSIEHRIACNCGAFAPYFFAFWLASALNQTGSLADAL